MVREAKNPELINKEEKIEKIIHELENREIKYFLIPILKKFTVRDWKQLKN